MGSNIISIFVAQLIVRFTIKKRGFMSATCMWVIGGRFASAVVQFGLVVIVALDTDFHAFHGFVVMWVFSQIFGVCSSLATMFIFPTHVPPHKRGQLNGLRSSVQAAVNCICPVTLALIYQTG